MKQYQETESGSYTIGGVNIPASEGNRHYCQMQAEVDAGVAEIIPFDHDAQASTDAENAERNWRDQELTRADIELRKVQDGNSKAVGSVGDWRGYRNDLRDYPGTVDFPEGDRPTAPGA